MTPSREQAFDQWLIARYLDSLEKLIEFRATCERDLMREAHAAGREQGLREAKEVCIAQADRFMQGSPLEGNKPYAAKECAAAIEQLTKPAGAG